VLRIVGGANVPTGHLRMNANWPLAVLEYDGRQVAVTVRGGAFGAKPLYAGPNDLASVFRVRLMARRGVGFGCPMVASGTSGPATGSTCCQRSRKRVTQSRLANTERRRHGAWRRRHRATSN
jgi:hypothetical protein